MGDKMKHHEKRTGHGTQGEKTLSNIGNTLLDDMCGFKGVAPISWVAIRVILLDSFGDAEGLGMEWSLRNKPVRKWQAENARNTGCQAKEEDIPVETSGFTKREFATLCDQ